MKTKLEDFKDKKIENMSYIIGGSGNGDGDIDKDKISRTSPKKNT